MTLINGEGVSDVPADDRGLAYGDGVFETIAVVSGNPGLWQSHYARLAHGCRLLGFEPPGEAVLWNEVREVAGAANAVVRVTITRGSGGRGYRAPAAPEPRRIVSGNALPAYPIGHWQDGIAVRLCETQLPHRPALGGSKHLNRLEQVIARSEWDDTAIPEGLMLTADGASVAEGTMTNLFARFGDRLVTPPVRECGVEGVMRSRVMAEYAKSAKPVQEAALTLTDLEGADEIFVTNSVIGLWPVRDLAGRAAWQQWPLAQELLARFTGQGVMLDWLGDGR